MIFLKYVSIIFDIIVLAFGIFHQLIVGGVITRLKDCDERDLRLYLMSWISHGSYITFLGVISLVFLLFYSDIMLNTRIFYLVLALSSLIFSIHIGITSFKYDIPPIKIEFFLLIFYSLLHFIYYFI